MATVFKFNEALVLDVSEASLTSTQTPATAICWTAHVTVGEQQASGVAQFPIPFPRLTSASKDTSGKKITIGGANLTTPNACGNPLKLQLQNGSEPPQDATGAAWTSATQATLDAPASGGNWSVILKDGNLTLAQVKLQ